MPTEREQLLQARELITAKQYAKARAILRGMPRSATAQQWLAKLDQIAPEQAAPAAVPVHPSPPPNQEPVDPVQIERWRLWFVPVMMWKYTRNWARLGKPDWMWNTALGGLLIFAWLIVAGVTLALNLRSILAIGFLVSAAMTNLAFWMIIGQLQRGAYKTWAATHDWDALRAHPYRINKTIVGILAVTVIATIAITAFLWYESRPTGYENDDLRLVYDSSWKTRDAAGVTLCQDYEYGCFLVLTDKQFGMTTIAFVKTHLTGQVRTAADADAYLWANYWGQVSGVELVSREELAIDGLPAVSREFFYPQEGDDPLYIKVFLVVNGQARYDITVWAATKAVFDEDRTKIMDVIDSVDFKRTGASVWRTEPETLAAIP